MSRAPFDLARLLSPVGAEAFFSTHWEREPLHIARGSPAHYDELIRGADLAALVGSPDSRYPSIRLAQAGGFFPPEAYTHSLRYGDESFTGLPDVARINDAYRHGATITLPALDRRWPALGALCESLEAEWSHVVNTNAYITPGNAAGFTPHYDTHEVFVLQIAGRKHWRLQAPPLALPHRSQSCTPQAMAGLGPARELTLQPGDLLYLPRGTVHAARTGESFSAHVTLGIAMYTTVELLQDLLHEAIQDPVLRASLPLGFARDPGCRPELARRLRQALDALRCTGGSDALLERFTRRVRGSHRKAAEPFDPDVQAIGPDTRLSLPPEGTYRLAETAPGSHRLEFGSRRFGCPPPILGVVRAMLERRTFRLSDLRHAGDLQTLQGIARQLHDVGFLSILPATPLR